MLRWKNKSGVVVAIVAAASLMATTKSYATNADPTWDNQTWVDSASTAVKGSGSTERDNRGTTSGVYVPPFNITDISVIDPNVRKVANDLAGLLGNNQTITAKCSVGAYNTKVIAKPSTAIPTMGSYEGDFDMVDMPGAVEFDIVFDKKKGYILPSISDSIADLTNKKVVIEGAVKNFSQRTILNKFTRIYNQGEFIDTNYFGYMHLGSSGTAVPAGYVFSSYMYVDQSGLSQPVGEKNVKAKFRPNNQLSGVYLNSKTTIPNCKRTTIYRSPTQVTNCIVFSCSSYYEYYRNTNETITSCETYAPEINVNTTVAEIGTKIAPKNSTSYIAREWNSIPGLGYAAENYVDLSSKRVCYYGCNPVTYSHGGVVKTQNKIGVALNHIKDNATGKYTDTVRVNIDMLGETEGGSLVQIYPAVSRAFRISSGTTHTATGIKSNHPTAADYPAEELNNNVSLTCKFQ